MRATVTFHALARVSEDARRSKETFSPSRNLFAGLNETGKSRVLKHLVWTLGCEPAARNAGSWDSNITAATELSVGNEVHPLALGAAPTCCVRRRREINPRH